MKAHEEFDKISIPLDIPSRRVYVREILGLNTVDDRAVCRLDLNTAANIMDSRFVVNLVIEKDESK